MPNPPTFNLAAAHKFFTAECYNKTWGFMDNPKRTPEEDLSMLQAAMASLWRWSQREDSTPTNFSIGYRQVSRVFARLGGTSVQLGFKLLKVEPHKPVEAQAVVED